MMKTMMMTRAKSQKCWFGVLVGFSCGKAWPRGSDESASGCFAATSASCDPGCWVAAPVCGEIRLQQPCVIIAHELCGSGVGKYKQRAKIRVPVQQLLVPDKMFSLLAAFAAPDGIGAMPTFVSAPP